MIDPKSNKRDKLKSARDLFEAAHDHFAECNEERRLWARCHHNTEGKGQWPEDIISVLRQEKRPYWSFNLVHGKVHNFVGMQRDVRKSPVAKPVGREDRFLAGIVNTISDRIRSKANADRSDAAILRNGAIRGEGDGQLYVSRDPKRPDWLKVEYKSLSPHQVLWDPMSTEQDRSDARYVCISTWMDRSQFGQRYPEHKKQFEVLRKGILSGDEALADRDTEAFLIDSRPDEYEKVKTSKYYFDEKRKMIRVISVEYKSYVTKWYLFNPDTGDTKDIDTVEITDFDGSILEGAEKREMLDAHIRSGVLPNIQLISADSDEVYWLEFIGSTVLYDKPSPQPFNGFSVEPYLFFLDDETNTPYGMVRNLYDPQTQVNKSYCLTIELSANQAKPGMDIEDGAHSDPELLEEQIRTSGSVAVFADGAISQGKIRDRVVPQVSSAAEKRLENDIGMIDRVSGIYPSAENINQAEAALTHQIRAHKARMVHMDPFESFEDYQIGMERRIIETIVRSMPDTQIAALLGNDEKYRVLKTPGGSMVLEVEIDADNPQGQPKVVNSALLSTLRTLDSDIELESSNENTELRMIEFGILMQLIAAGKAIPDELLLERAIQNRGDREFAIDFAKEASASAAKMQEREAQRIDAQIKYLSQGEIFREQERARHNVVDEQLQARKQLTDFITDIAAIWEKSDESEKRTVLEILKTLQQQQASRGGMSMPGMMQ